MGCAGKTDLVEELGKDEKDLEIGREHRVGVLLGGECCNVE